MRLLNLQRKGAEDAKEIGERAHTPLGRFRFVVRYETNRPPLRFSALFAPLR
jgi:hypothetical protein